MEDTQAKIEPRRAASSIAADKDCSVHGGGRTLRASLSYSNMSNIGDDKQQFKHVSGRLEYTCAKCTN